MRRNCLRTQRIPKDALHNPVQLMHGVGLSRPAMVRRSSQMRPL